MKSVVVQRCVTVMTRPGFFLDIRSKTQGEKTKTQARTTQNSISTKLKIPAIFSEIQEDF